MDTSNQLETTQDDNPLIKQALEMRELIKKVRADAGLGSIIQPKRTFSALREKPDTEEQIERAKIQKIEQEQAEAEAEAKKAHLLEEKRSLFFSRLKSYSPRFQYRKRPFTALDSAKHGWRDTHLTGKADSKTCILECDKCHGKMFVISLDPHSDNLKVKEVTKIYKEGLMTCHAEDCQWRNGPDEDIVYNFPIVSLEDGLEIFKNNARMFIKCEQEHKTKTNTNLPLEVKQHSSIPPLEHPLDEATLSKVLKLATHFQQQNEQQQAIEAIDSIDAETTNAAYLLSLFGWQLLDPLVPGIECKLCCSRKGFYQIKSENKLDVLKEHREYCPWVNPETAGAFSPKISSLTRNRQIKGYEWMVDMIAIEYELYMRNRYLSLASRHATDDGQYQLKRKMHEANDLLKLWNSYSTGF
ncbi:hypothetical protein BD408DRAFT_414205 [Parasitella parasitica]|nr:hypothetical protein BD408DRAFT_414205 [Parasitella parasitica]